jgi:hypothetical protein
MKLTAKIKSKQTFMRDLLNPLVPPERIDGLTVLRYGGTFSLALVEPVAPYYVRVSPKISEQKAKQRY